MLDLVKYNKHIIQFKKVIMKKLPADVSILTNDGGVYHNNFNAQ